VAALPVKLEVRDLVVKYYTARGAHVALQDVSLDVYEGEKLVLLGPSGCGKSTLLKTIAAFEQAASGTVLLDGQPVSKPGPDRAVVFQEFDQLFPWRTVKDNVVYAVRVTKCCRREEIEGRALHYLAMVGLSQYADFYPHHLSGGMKMRVAIARALAISPKVLLMDEPFAALDAQNRAVLQNEVNQIQAETKQTLIFVTHSIEEAIVIGHRIAVMTAGPGRIKAILPNPVSGANVLERPEAAALHKEIRGLLQHLGGKAS
jgi:NitT/TauT family transport system ATP-binding protein